MTETWIDLLDPNHEALRDALPIDVYDTAADQMELPARHGDEPRPRLELHGEYLFGVLVLPVPGHLDHDLVYQEIDVVVTHDRMLTVRKTPPGAAAFHLDGVRTGAMASRASSA